MRQVFQRDVYGGVAARDVVYNIDLSSCAEYEAQHLFEACTRISCSRQARAQLTYLGRHCDFEFPQLRRAIGAGALVWSKDSQRWRKTSPFADYFVAAAFVFCLVLLLAGGVGLIWTHLSGSHAFIATLLGVAVFMFLLGGLQLQFVKPHRTARAATLALDSAPSQTFEERTA